MAESNSELAKKSLRKIPGLDLLRAIAILLVFFYHYSGMFQHPEWIEGIRHFGWTGVDLFFVLSGYLISSQMFASIRNEGDFSRRQFFIKRFFRIIPSYLFVVAIYFLLPSFREREGPAPLWKYLTFTQNLGLNLRTQGTFSHAWSLCIEEQFYLCLPLIMAALIYFKALKKGAYVSLFLFLAGFAIRIFAWQAQVLPVEDSSAFYIRWYKWIYYPTYTRLDGLLVGVSIAALTSFSSRFRKLVAGRSLVILALGILLLCAAYFVCLEQQSWEASVFGFPLVAVGYGVVLIAVVAPSGLIAKVNSLVIARLATFSYAIYLSHKIVIHLTQSLLARSDIAPDGNLMLIICIAASVLISYLMQLIIEKPALRLRNYLLKASQV